MLLLHLLEQEISASLPYHVVNDGPSHCQLDHGQEDALIDLIGPKSGASTAPGYALGQC